MSNSNSFKSSGISAPIIGLGMAFFGGLSAISSFFGPSVIDTPFESGGDGVIGIIIGVVGFLVAKRRDWLTAWLALTVCVVLLTYANYTFDGDRATTMVSAAAKAAKAAGSAAKNSAYSDNNVTVIHADDARRPLTKREIDWCVQGEIDSNNCRTRTCPIRVCGK